jgi:hypothetical protein
MRGHLRQTAGGVTVGVAEADRRKIPHRRIGGPVITGNGLKTLDAVGPPDNARSVEPRVREFWIRTVGRGDTDPARLNVVSHKFDTSLCQSKSASQPRCAS